MLVQKWMLPTLKKILNWKFDRVQSWGSDNSQLSPSQLQAQAAQEWRAALAATEDLLLQSIDSNGDRLLSPQGVVFAGSSPLWSNETLLIQLPTGIFVEQSSENSPQLSPAKATVCSQNATPQQLFLLNNDPLAQEPFCLILTAKFSLLLVLGCDSSGNQAFRFSFEPEEAAKVWQLLRSRLLLTNSLLVDKFDTLVKKFEPVAPDYRVVTNFSHLLLSRSHAKPPQEEHLVTRNHRSDIELLQAFAHEVRTPLTTIRTLTRLLLKRKDLAPEVKKRLETIDSECTAQVNRMELIFKAAEMVEKPAVSNTLTPLTAMSLAQVLQRSIPRWQQQAHQRNLTIDVILPQHLPTVVSDPTILDQVLTGLIENFTRNLTAGSHIQVQVIPAGNQLKLQLLHQSLAGECDKLPPPHVKSLGKLLMFQPETGNISLNLNATKYLFQAIGGKLIVRQRPDEGEVLTIFLPMDLSHPPIYQPSC